MRLVILLLCFGSWIPMTAVSAADRPNVVLILADDLGINDLHCYGRADHNTPHLDRLASQGARFTSAYCGLSICSASRSSLMTGKSPARLHLTTFLPGRPDTNTQKLLHPVINQHLPLDEVTLAERFKALGYATGLFGKWHLGGKGFQPTDQGFDEAFQSPGNSEPSATEGGKSEYAITSRAIAFIEKNRERPFFCYVPHNNPHVRLAAKPELVEKNKGAFNPIYAGMIETLDDTVGLVLKTLEDNKLADNTIVIFTSDNGGLHIVELPDTPATHNTPYRAGKGYLYEGGLRIPLIIRWPGKVPARVIDWPTVNSDFTPTLMEMCGGTVAEAIDGVSIAQPLMSKANVAPRTFAFHFPHYTNQGSRPAGSIRDGNWKLIEYYDDGSLELFDLAKDVGEQTNLVATELDRAKRMQAQLAAWRTSVGAQTNSPNPAYEQAAGDRIYRDFNSSLFPIKSTAVETAPVLLEWRRLMDEAVAGAKPKRKRE